MLENNNNDEEMKAVIEETDEGYLLLIYDSDGECTDEYEHESLDLAIAHAEDDFGFAPSGWTEQS